MRDHGFIRMSLTVLAVGLAVGAFVPACQAGGVNKKAPSGQQKRFEAMQAKGAQASLTVFPVVMGGSAIKDVADVLALLLEEAGMTNMQTTEAVFRLPKETAFDQVAERFGEFVRKNPIETDYALYAEFVGGPPTGPKEIRGVIVDRNGQSVWVDRQTAADRDFKRAKPSHPMACCYFLAERVRTQLGIPESARDNNGDGKIGSGSLSPKSEWKVEQGRSTDRKNGASDHKKPSC